MMHFQPTLLLLLLLAASAKSEVGTFEILSNWNAGYHAKASVLLSEKVGADGWILTLKFSRPVKSVDQWTGNQISSDGQTFELENRYYNAQQSAGANFEITMNVYKQTLDEDPATATVTFKRRNVGGGGGEETTSAPVTSNPPTLPTGSTQGTFTITSDSGWLTGFDAQVIFRIGTDRKEGWHVTITFSNSIKGLNVWNGDITSKNGRTYMIRNKPWNKELFRCSTFVLKLQGIKKSYISNPSAVAFINIPPGDGSCSVSTSPPTNPPPTTNAAVTTVAPVPSTNAPVTTAAPVSSTNAPVTTAAPVPSTNAPVTTAAPVSSTNAPVTTAAPVPSTNAPVTTAAPVSSTNAPITTAAPVPSTNAPVTTAPPVPSTSGPSTESPDECTEEPDPSTTQSPQPTTQPPVVTQPPPPTTQSPVVTQSPPVPTTPPQSGAYNYNEVLHKSILFYEAQRSGKLPANNRISWRKDSALNDRGENGEDLTGGWYDAGDYVKFGFPMASSATVLAWGLVEYREAYQSAGELSNVLDSIKWATDYFIKAHTAKYEFYGQVGDGNKDHGYWGRPEDMTMSRPSFKITSFRPGSDLAAETAAALAAASIAFKATNPSYSQTLVTHAKQLYEMADLYRGKYTDSIPNAAGFYNSWSGYKDELVWGAAWLFRATQDNSYLTKAEKYARDFGIVNSGIQEFSWDDKKAGALLLLTQMTNKDDYKQSVQRFLNRWLPGGGIAYTPKGLAWHAQWGPNRYSANTAFLALVAADLGLKPTKYRGFARKQIHYMLGDSGRSFVVGFGTNPPQRPHHRSSSCPLAPSPCNWSNKDAPGPNPQVLHGALVGGPDRNDNYKDDRGDYIKNEVATDYNAGFQSAVAGLKRLQVQGLL